MAALSPMLPVRGLAQSGGGALRLRLDGDPDLLDPGCMSGGVEIEAQKQRLPFLAQYTREGGPSARRRQRPPGRRQAPRRPARGPA